MGIGSPRRLTRLVLRTAVACTAAFGFAPAAHAALAPGVPVPPAPTSPVPIPVSSVDPPVSATPTVHVAAPAAPTGAVPVQAQPKTPQLPSVHASGLTATPVGAGSKSEPVHTRSQAPAAIKRRAAARKALQRSHTASSSSPKRGAPAPRTAETTPFRRLATGPTSQSAGPAPRHEPGFPPLPRSLFTGVPGVGASTALALLLFALAAALAAVSAPSLLRRLAFALRAPQPYPFRLVLERPD